MPAISVRRTVATSYDKKMTVAADGCYPFAADAALRSTVSARRALPPENYAVVSADTGTRCLKLGCHNSPE